ncbi:hypothetical protein DRW48_15465 [Paracoccus suum]|uniref:DUF5337 domain-containing protein n=1 Tax=Paracoccus suum TaxID=2259340 RepID=A0A344PND7_9RHOB|nr:DUF5337 domain-containing protein [Paracoccus suum]AXC50892.1 hypothetical protein DRW48_15465 [Paracoccus suum]
MASRRQRSLASAEAKAAADAAAAAQARRDSGQARLGGGVMAAAMVLWLGLQWLGGKYGWEARYAFLIDLAAIAALVWSLAVTWRIWQRRRTA